MSHPWNRLEVSLLPRQRESPTHSTGREGRCVVLREDESIRREEHEVNKLTKFTIEEGGGGGGGGRGGRGG